MALGQYLWAGASVTKLLARHDGDSTDSSGNWNDGTAANCSFVPWVTGSNAVRFNGSNATENFPNASFPYGSNTVTIAFWANNFSNSGNRMWIWTARIGQWVLVYTSAGFFVFSKPNVSDLAPTYSPPTSWWHHYCFRADGSWMSIAVDGVTIATNSNSSNFVSSWDPLYLGWYYNNGLLVPWWYSQLDVDEFIIDSYRWGDDYLQNQITATKWRFATT